MKYMYLMALTTVYASADTLESNESFMMALSGLMCGFLLSYFIFNEVS